MPVIDDGAADVVAVTLATLLEFAGSFCDLLDEVLRVDPSLNSKEVDDVLHLHSVKDGLDVALRIRDTL